MRGARANKFTYDPVGNLTNIHYPASGTIQFTYDAMNRLATMVDGLGATVYGYDAAGQLLTEDGPFASDTVTNTYVNRLRTALSLQQPVGAWTNGFGWDAARRLTNVTSPAGGFTYAYAGVGQAASPAPLVQELALPNGAYVTNTFDSVARLLVTRLNNSTGSALDGYAYVCDPANERTNLTRADGSTVAYGYDLIGQLKGAKSSPNTEDFGYTYDPAWNMTWRTNSGTNFANLTQYTYDLKNELARINSQYLNYDLNGNLVTNPVAGLGYVYDDENRLVEVYHLPPGSPGPQIPQPTGGWKSDFAYDGLGRMRVRRDYYSYGTPVGWYLTNTTEYVYDGNRVIQERDVNNTPTVTYTRGLDLSGTLEGAGGIGGLLARSTGYGSGWNSHNYYYADGNGNITYMLDAGQAMVASYRYDPFGNTISKSGTLADANLYRFSSKPVHVYSGLYYYLYRFYHPNLQRWINRDPIDEGGGVSLYDFVANNPIGFVDLYGLGYGNPVPPCAPYPDCLGGSSPPPQLPPTPALVPAVKQLPKPEPARTPKRPPRGLPRPGRPIINPTMVFCLAMAPMSTGPEPIFTEHGWEWPSPRMDAPKEPTERCNLQYREGNDCVYWCPGTRQTIKVSRFEFPGGECEEDHDIPIPGRFP